jgi:hypothetical protein
MLANPETNVNTAAVQRRHGLRPAWTVCLAARAELATPARVATGRARPIIAATATAAGAQLKKLSAPSGAAVRCPALCALAVGPAQVLIKIVAAALLTGKADD